MTRLWRALAFLAAAGAALVLSTSAFAIGAGSSRTQIQWKASIGPATWSGKLTALYPGASHDTERVRITVTNTGRSAQRLSSVSASIPTRANGDAQTAAGADIRGCRAAWFSASIGGGASTLPVELSRGAVYAGHVDLVMRDSGTNQDACRGASPAITVTAR
jgi:hypothetical protein